MIRGFTFERALSWPFTAPHVATFPWVFGLAYALVFMTLIGVIGLLGAGDFIAWIEALEAADGTNDPDLALAVLLSGLFKLLPWVGLLGLASWAVWAMFETASQRRYVFGQTFSLGFGADELRMMAVGFLWSLLGTVLLAVPILLIMGSAFAVMFAGSTGLSEDEVAQQILGPMLAAFGVMFLIFPVYVFFATRLAPCFALTVRERKIRFFDAWNVSRGRFWPILGAYVILAICGGMLGQVIAGIAQLLLVPTMVSFNATNQNPDQIAAVLTSPGFLVPLGFYLFIVLFVQGVLQHAVGGPAAFAVRHDPRGGVEEENQIEAFN
jgi:hypothetical protein